MLLYLLIFIISLAVLLISANFFTDAATEIGGYFNMPSFVIGIFIVGIGTSLPELISGILSVRQGASEILSGNILGANISNLLLVTGIAVIMNRKKIDLGKTYIFTDLNFLIGSFFYFTIIAYDGTITFSEAFMGIAIFLIYSYHLIKGNKETENTEKTSQAATFPLKSLLIILVCCVGIYFGAEYTIFSIGKMAALLNIPRSIIALTLLSLGTTLPELSVNIAAIRKKNAEMAIGNTLGSSISNTLLIPSLGSIFGTIIVPTNLLGFSLPVMLAAGIIFYLVAMDKKISVTEGSLFTSLYILFLIKIIAG